MKVRRLIQSRSKVDPKSKFAYVRAYKAYFPTALRSPAACLYNMMTTGCWWSGNSVRLRRQILRLQEFLTLPKVNDGDRIYDCYVCPRYPVSEVNRRANVVSSGPKISHEISGKTPRRTPLEKNEIWQTFSTSYFIHVKLNHLKIFIL